MAEKAPHHGFKSTHIEHHSDGSHTIHHQHHEDSAKDKHHAVADLDQVHDKLEDNLGEPNAGEAEAAGAAPAGGAAPAPAAAPAGPGM
jgi:hypothetical protein